MNFQTNELLTIDKIIKSCFANPDRRRHPALVAGDITLPLVTEELTADHWIDKTRSQMPTQYHQFNNRNIRLLDRSNLKRHDQQKVENFFSSLSNRFNDWYGPFRKV